MKPSSAKSFSLPVITVSTTGGASKLPYMAASTYSKLRPPSSMAIFAALLERAELHERTAQRWMQLARAGWTAQEVQDVGGINVAASKSNERIRENEVLADLDMCKDAVTELTLERDSLMAEIDPAFRDKIIAELEVSRRLRARVDTILDDLNAEAAKRQRFETWAKSHGWTADRIS